MACACTEDSKDTVPDSTSRFNYRGKDKEKFYNDHIQCQIYDTEQTGKMY